MFDVEDTPYNWYKVDMVTSTLEAPVPWAFKVPSTSSNKSKILDANKLFDICFPTLNMNCFQGIYHHFPPWKNPQLPMMFNLFGIIRCDLMFMLPPHTNVPILGWNARGDEKGEIWVLGWEMDNCCYLAKPRLMTQVIQLKSMTWPKKCLLMVSNKTRK